MVPGHRPRCSGTLFCQALRSQKPSTGSSIPACSNASEAVLLFVLYGLRLLGGVLARFGIPVGSQQAADMDETLGMCEAQSTHAGEAKFHATSLETLVEGAIAALGTSDIRPVTSTLPRSGAPLQPYTIRAVRPIDGSRFVACHSGHYPYTVYLCHDTGDVRAYMADMEGANGGGALTLAIVCHTDTSLWNPEHLSFKQLGTKPGGKPV
ncbi:hypothetical protein EJB05_49642, partial [Eragrostis curvula]